MPKKYDTFEKILMLTGTVIVLSNLLFMTINSYTTHVFSLLLLTAYVVLVALSLTYVYVKEEAKSYSFRWFTEREKTPSILEEYSKKKFLSYFDIKFILYRLFPESQLSGERVEEILDYMKGGKHENR